MRAFVKSAAATICLAMAGSLSAQEKTDVRLDGNWKVLSVRSQGKEVPKASGSLFLFKTGRVRTVDAWNGQDEGALFRTDPAKWPAHIDLRPDGGTDKDIVRGIYDVNGDKLWVAFARPDAKPDEKTPLPRPRSFDDPNATVAEYVRIGDVEARKIIEAAEKSRLNRGKPDSPKSASTK